MVEQTRSSKNNWSSKIGRAKIFGRAKMVEQKNLVEQKAVQIVPPSCPAGPSCGTAPMSKITIKPLKNHNIFFARTNLLMNVFSQFWLSGGRHFGSLWGAISSVILGERFWVSVGCHSGPAVGDIIILVRITTTSI